MSPKIIEYAKKKAGQSICKYRISAIGLDKFGKVLGAAMNRPMLSKYHGGVHAEMSLLQRYKNNVKTIILCRVSASGNLLPIDPCERCAKVLDKMNIKVVSIR